MRTIESANAFKRDYKHIKAMPRYRKSIDSLLFDIVSLLQIDKALPENNYDHSLSGQWCGYRECHVKPDLLLIYKKPDPHTLRLGSHSELFS